MTSGSGKLKKKKIQEKFHRVIIKTMKFHYLADSAPGDGERD